MKHAPIDDARIAYDVAGDDGTPVLLIMGFAVRGLAWRRQVPPIAERHRVVWFDNRGVGKTEARLRPLTMKRFAADAVGLLDHLGLDRAHVVGISMGGMIAQHVALNHRDRLRSLSLIATHSGGLRAFLPTRIGTRLFLKANKGGPGSGQATMELLMSPEHLARCDRGALLRDLQAEFDENMSRRGRLAQASAMLRHDTRKRLHALSGLPTLVMQPAADRLIRSEHSARLARAIPGAKLLTIPTVGHGLLRETPRLVTDALLDHFATVDGSRAE